jgi:hypothetical protein
VPLRDRLIGWTDDADIYCDPQVYKAPSSDSRVSVAQVVSTNEAVGLMADEAKQRTGDESMQRKSNYHKQSNRATVEEEQRKLTWSSHVAFC